MLVDAFAAGSRDAPVLGRRHRVARLDRVGVDVDVAPEEVAVVEQRRRLRLVARVRRRVVERRWPRSGR
jgi:hypothetical protein